MQFTDDGVNRALGVKFNIDDEDQSEYTAIGSDQIEIVLFNTEDLHIFNYYHYLDKYGVICTDKVSRPADILCSDWSLIYDPNSKIPSEVSAYANKYIEDKLGNKKYLQTIDLDKFSHLSDVYALQTNARLSFKYSEEDVFPFNADNYYFPNLNVKYPKLLGEIMTSPSCQLGQMENVVDPAKVFDDTNLFTVSPIDPIISSEMKRIELTQSHLSFDSLDGFEKYTEFADGFELSAVFNKYNADDPRSMQQVEFLEFNSDEHAADSASVKSMATIVFDDANYNTSQAFLDRVEQLGENLSATVNPFGQDAAVSMISQTVSFDVLSVDFDDLLKLNVNYKATADGIVLYFNYINYLNTPFIKIENGRLYPDYIESSFCRLAPAETGYVSIIVQIRQYSNADVIGCRNIEVATFKVTNLSDDKPKFFLQRVKTLSADDLKQAILQPNVNITVKKTVIDLKGHGAEDVIRAKTEVAVSTDRYLQVPYQFDLNYPLDLVEVLPNDNDMFSVEEVAPGNASVIVHNKLVDTISLDVQTKKTASQLENMKNAYQVYIGEADLTGENGLAADVELIPGALVVKES